MTTSLQLKKLHSVLLKHPKVTVGNGLKIESLHHFILYPKIKKFTLRKDISFRNDVVTIQNTASLEIKYNVYFNNRYSINLLENNFIGENTFLIKNIKFYNHNHSYQRNENDLMLRPSNLITSLIVNGLVKYEN